MMPIIEEPPKEDSSDLTDDEVAAAVAVADIHEVTAAVVERVRSGLQVESFELRRRGDAIFWRLRFQPNFVLVFRITW